MFVSGANYSKLKTNLRLIVSRLKLLEKKKTELAQKARREIADFLSNGKLERARIKVEHIIREDYLVEAMELVEMYCDLLLARFGLIQQMKTLDEGLSEAISSIIWVTPRLQADCAELKLVSDQLTIKYGKPYAQAARENTLQTVNEKLIQKLSVQAPPRILVERYLIEIAKSHNIPYEPDLNVMREDEVLAADMMQGANTLISFDDNEKPGGYPPPGPPGFGGGFNHSGMGGGSFNGGGAMGGESFNGVGAMGGGHPFISAPQAQPPQMPPFNYPQPSQQADAPMKPPRCSAEAMPPPLPMMPPSGPYPGDNYNPHSMPPPYDNIMGQSRENPNFFPNAPANEFKSKPQAAINPIDTLPELPSVPDHTLPDFDKSTSKSDDLDFDELTKRFEELKKKK